MRCHLDGLTKGEMVYLRHIVLAHDHSVYLVAIRGLAGWSKCILGSSW